MKFSIKDFFSKCDQISSFLRIWSHLLKKYLMENLIFFFAVLVLNLKNLKLRPVNEFRFLSECLEKVCSYKHLGKIYIEKLKKFFPVSYNI